ncbi:DUF6406 domain-containing protein [Streptomyces sp. NPDC089915]|uniref:DUF6406 domain-containing protein n=1 Tax=Streptomyces sp. NPDC089915 TaxID=3155186 RepID=UPI00344740B8
MKAGEVVLRHAVPQICAEVELMAIHVYAPDGEVVKVFLWVKVDAVEEYELGIGDVFSVRGGTWVLDRVEDHLSRNYRVILRKVE